LSLEVTPDAASAFTVMDIRDRAELAIPEFLAPSATCCLVIEPAPLTESWVRMFTIGGWAPNAGRMNCYGRWFGDAVVYVSMEDEYWIVEVSYPGSRQPAAVLGIGCGLVVTLNPMAAVQLAKACMVDSGPPLPFKWSTYS
jgi:hypothetical protein